MGSCACKIFHAQQFVNILRTANILHWTHEFKKCKYSVNHRRPLFGGNIGARLKGEAEIRKFSL